ncbi:MAG: hypothetical protein H7A45_05560 [Verrucomicrobiales bacterium]|nr:hypothetical protein [Verrucomicrobiales bacterium]
MFACIRGGLLPCYWALLPMANAASTPGALAGLWSLLEDADVPVLRQTWPGEAALPLVAALERTAPEAARRLRQSQAFLAGLLRVPVVAVAGLINAGKSSLVASFLSPAGRARVLRGVTRQAGTHRFCLWAPQAWENDTAFRAGLEQLLREVFAQPVEALAADPSEAHDQQRARRLLQRPLLAFDAALDRHGLALLDCPDIQRREAEDDPGRGLRRQALQGAGRICSAVLVVLPRSQLEIEPVEEVLASLPNAMRVLAVNFAGREDAAAILAEARLAVADPTARFHVAYDFNHHGYEERTPAWDPNRTVPVEALDERGLPCFFEPAERAEDNRPEAVAPERSLLALGSRFTPEMLLQQRQRELLREFVDGVREGIQTLSRQAAERQQQTRTAARALRGELFPLLETEGGLRIKLDTELVGELAESLIRTAPWDVRPFLWTSQRARGLVRSLGRGLSGAGSLMKHLSRPVRESVERVGPQIQDGLVGEEAVADRLRLWSAACGAHRERDFWRPAARTLLQRFRDQERSRLTQEEWDEMTTGLWRALPKWKARVAVAGTLVATLAAVGLLAFDGGASLLTIAGIKALGGATLTVTTKELLGAIGFGVLAQGEASRRLQRRMETLLSRQQLANLLALGFDVVGLPRALLAEVEDDRLPAATVAVETDAEAFAPTVLGLAGFAVQAEAVRRIERELNRLLR